MDVPKTPVRAVMSTPVETVDGQAAVREAAGTLIEEEAGSVVVTGIGEDGILTKTDIVTGLHNGVDPDATPAAGLMSSPVITVEHDASLEDAVERMATEEVKRLVVEEDGETVGILTTTDIVDELAPGLDGVIGTFADAV